MFSPRILKFLAVFVLLLFAMLACNLPNRSPTVSQDSEVVYTVAARTLEEEMTQIALERSPTPIASTTPLPIARTITPSLPTQTIVLPTNELTPSPTATSIPCDKAEFVEDVTIEDGTDVSVGEPFKKIWRLKNAGSCTWTSSYDLVFDGGTQMGAADAQQLTTETVAPDQEIDIAVNLIAPDDPGKYRANFKLRNPSGTIFGLGENSNPFWVEVRVPDESGVRFDFLARAKDADWGSGTEPVDFANPGHVELSYGGPTTDENGFVLIQDKVKLETGKSSAKILQTHPKWVEYGYIVGKYPAYRVGSGDYIKAQLGFIALKDGSCGAGDVVFEIHYTTDDDLGTRTRLGKWSKSCDGQLFSIQLSLQDLKGENVHFYLVVLADGPATQDLAIWSSLGVMR